MKRIVLSGVQSSGKSTLLNEIKKETDIYVYEEVVRSLIKQGVVINKEANHVSQCLILETHYKNTLLNDEFITDRGAIDAFVYGVWNYLNGDFSYKEHKEQEQIFLNCLSAYNHHFYLPIEFQAVSDGVRDIDEVYRTELERLYYLTYRKYNIPFVELKGSINSRLSCFLKNIK